jgi:5,10-methenyltetrahydrofolate synthetase
MPSIAQEGVACGNAAQAPGAGDAEMQQTGGGAPPLPAAGLDAPKPAHTRAPQPGTDRQGAASAKAALRKRLKAGRASLDEADKQERDRRIGAQVLAWWRRTRPPLLAVYWPLIGEPDLQDTFRALAAEGAALALPVVVERHAPLAFAEWAPGEPMILDPMGVAVPEQLRTVARPPALLVPCLGFNEHGYRLGYGGGFYDRTLAGGVKPATLGIAYACQAADFEADEHDLPLDLIVTEETAVE